MNKFILYIITAAILLLACGCGTETVEEEPRPKPVPTDEPKEDAVYLIQNPAAQLYSEYNSCCDIPQKLLKAKLQNEASSEAVDAIIYMERHNMLVSEGRVSFGWLLSTDDVDTFSSTISGMTEGRGTIALYVGSDEAALDEEAEDDEEETSEEEDEKTKPTPLPTPSSTPELTPMSTPSPTLAPGYTPAPEKELPKEYDILFRYTDGRFLRGTLTADSMEFSSGEESVQISRTEKGWRSLVHHGNGIITLMMIEDDSAEFIVYRQLADGSTEELQRITTEQ